MAKKTAKPQPRTNPREEAKEVSDGLQPIRNQFVILSRPTPDPGPTKDFDANIRWDFQVLERAKPKKPEPIVKGNTDFRFKAMERFPSDRQKSKRPPSIGSMQVPGKPR